MCEVGKRIRSRRAELGYNAEELAHMVGLSPATIYRYENGDIKKVSTSKINPIAFALKTSAPYLMGWTDDPSPLVDEKKPESDILYISVPKGDMKSDEIRKMLHELIDQFDDDTLLLLKDLTLKIAK